MRIRPANEDDAAPIAALVVECDANADEDWAPATWTRPSYDDELAKARDAISSPTRRTIVGELDGSVAGYASLDFTSPTIAELKRLFVRPEHWGMGLASALLEDAIATAFAAGYRSMRLFTPTANVRARRFYEREGWHEDGTAVHDQLGVELTEYRRALGSRRR